MRFASLALVAAVLMIASGMLSPSSASTRGPVCVGSICLPGADDTATSPWLKRISDNDAARERFRRERIRRCCARYEAGLPLRGQYCSYQIVVQSYERYLCTR